MPPRSLNQLHRHLGLNPPHQNFWRRDALLAAGLGKIDMLFDDLVNLVHAGKPVLEVTRVFEAQLVCNVLEILDATAMEERQQVAAERMRVNVVLQLTPEKLVVQLVRCRQRAALDGIDASQVFTGLVMPPRNGGKAPVGPLIVVAAIAE